jgi:hypothetical protein
MREKRSVQVQEYNRSCAEERQRRHEMFLVNFKRITTMLGQSLYTLEVNLDSYSIPNDPFFRYILFHQLTSLTIDYVILHQLEQNRGLPSGNPRSKLRYLHLTGSDCPDPHQLLDDLRVLVPGLTHIRIPLDLAEYLEPKEEPRYSRLIRHPDEDHANQPKLLPAGIQRVFIQVLSKPEIEVNEVVGRYRELSLVDQRVVVVAADDAGVGMREVVDRYT